MGGRRAFNLPRLGKRHPQIPTKVTTAGTTFLIYWLVREASMSARKVLPVFTVLIAMVILTVFVAAILARLRDRARENAYRTPIPQERLSAFQRGQPVNTRLEAVIAAHYGIGETRLDWGREPEAIFAEKLAYSDALQRIEQPDTESYYDPVPTDTPVWLVVFKGEFTLTDPRGTVIAPFSECAYALINAQDGSRLRAGARECKSLKVDQ
jgi:hypothetical protein